MKNKYLEAAKKVGYELCRDAIRQDGKCNWLTMTYEYEESSGREIEVFKPLGNDFYSGSIGVSYFLSSLYDVCPERIFKDTAIGALKHAITHKEQIATEFIFSFYRGLPGIMLSISNLEDHLDESDVYLLNLVDDYIDELLHTEIKESRYDIIDGLASGVISLIKLYHDKPKDSLRQLILKMGQELSTSAEMSEHGVSWSSRGHEKINPIGFSHGTSGISTALFDLYVFTDDSLYLKLAMDAIRYENSYYDREDRNWLNVRTDDKTQMKNYSQLWCHGAPGIGMNRLKAFSVTSDQVVKRNLERCVDLTQLEIDQLINQDSDWSQCHGLSGLCDLLIDYQNTIKSKDSTYIDRVAHQSIELYLNNSATLKNGVHNHFQIPDFMLGMSGLGYFFLRLYDSIKFKSMLS